MIQERGLTEGIGSFTEVSIDATKRPRIKVPTDLLIPNNVVTVDNPSSSSVQQAVGTIISTAASTGVKTGSSISYRMTENNTFEQTAVDLGLDANYAGASLKTTLSNKNTASRHSISAVFIEKAFTVKADFEGRSGAAMFFNDKFTMDDARKMVDRGQISVNNLPAYLASVTYGRMLVFTMTSEASEAEMQAAIEASYKAGKLGASIDAKYSNLLNSSSTSITVASVGGADGGDCGADQFRKARRLL